MEIPFEKLSMQNAPPPKELSGVELLAYLSACHIYEQYHANKITRNEGTKMKKRIVEALQSATAKQNNDALRWARTENATRNYMQNKTIENADKMHNAFYNLSD